MIKEYRRVQDPRKQDFQPAVLDLGSVRFIIARHFGFCYGVENAIEISYKAVKENPDKRVFLLSQMIHNPLVNADLQKHGIRFIMDTDGTPFISWDELNKDDIVIIPAFGTTIEIEQKLERIGIEVQRYNTTCPFVEKVWNRSEKLGKEDYTIIIHGKYRHEETRATFSHSSVSGAALIIRDIREARLLGDYIAGGMSKDDFLRTFEGRFTAGFDPEKHLVRLGVVNQTTMLASETQAIADYLRKVITARYGEANYRSHFADTRDTLCYATNDNQEATRALLEIEADMAVIVGGYNSSNTSHIVELCEEKFPTYFISAPDEIKSKDEIHHFDFRQKEKKVTHGFLPDTGRPLNIIITSGASCPDTIVDQVLVKIFSYFEKEDLLEARIEKAMGCLLSP